MTMSKSEQAEFDRVTAELETAKAAVAERDATIAAQAQSVAKLLSQFDAEVAHARRLLQTLEAQDVTLGELRDELAKAKATPAPVSSPAPAPAPRPTVSKRPIGRVQGEYGFLVLADTHTVDTQYKAGDVMSEYAIDFYGPPAEAAYLARRTGMPVTTLADGTPRVTVPSQPQAAAIADGARKLVAQDSLQTKVRVQALRATGLQVQDAARATGAGVTGSFVALAAPRGAQVSAVDIDGVKGYLIET